MKRNLLRTTLVFSFLILVSAVSLAQTDPAPDVDPIVLSFTGDVSGMIAGVYEPLEQTDQTGAMMSPAALTADDPADSCSEATPLIIGPLNPADGNAADVSFATESDDDPVLRCMWGDPHRLRGNRTVWYKLSVPAAGTIDLSTFGSGYDTVLGVYSGECAKLTKIRCNDDANGFTSATSFPVSEGVTYYIEVADWQPGIVNNTELQFSALLQPIESQWEHVSFKPATPAISRHATVTRGDYIFVVGGQSGQPNLPLISNQLLRFDTKEQRWDKLNSIPGAGYSNNTAALVGNKIYVPSGYDGNNLGYDGLHWAYDLSNDSWSNAARIPESDLPYGVPFAHADAVVPPSNNRYFLTGGLSSPEETFATPDANVNDTTFVYLPDVNSWLKWPSMQAGRYAHTATWLDNGNLGLCVAGGIGVQVDEENLAVLHRSSECYTPGGEWQYMGDMQIPRFGAGSVVGPDGKWYVFGGITAGQNGFQPVYQVEVYNPQTRTWSLLQPAYNLGNFLSLPARGWPSGEVIGNELFVIGGSIGIMLFAEQAIPLVEKVYLPSDNVFMPVTAGAYDDFYRPDDNFSQARHIAYGIPQSRNFHSQLDFFDFFYFDVTSNRRVIIDLEVPDGNNFDLHLYGQNKLLWASSAQVFNGQDEHLSLELAPRRYYIKVQRTTPSGAPDKGAVYKLSLR